MPLNRHAVPEPLDVADDYGLNELGENHRSLDDVYRAIAEARNWWVVTVTASGRPHAAPVWGLIVEDHMLFCSDASSAKTRNLLAAPGITMHLESGDDVVIVDGTCKVVAAQDLPASFIDAYETKYDFRPDPTASAFTTHEVSPTKVLAWHEADFAATAARWRFA